jgi:general secretion pathway protein A
LFFLNLPSGNEAFSPRPKVMLEVDLYLDHWNLNQAPFENVPDPNFLYYTPQHQEALSRMVYAAETKKGAALLTGEAGCGKTTLSRALIHHLPDNCYDVSLVVNPSLNSEDMLKEILYQFGIQTADNTKSDLLHNLNERIVHNLQNDLHSIIIVDEAHSITEDATFEELRLLLNFQLNDRFLLTLILIGQDELRDRLARTPALHQRISVKAHLEPLDFDECVNYISFRLKQVGFEQNLFSKQASEFIHQTSGGIPRRINTICDLCLLEASKSKADLVNSSIVKQVIQEL